MMPTIITEGAASARSFGFAARSTAATFIEDVFSTYLYTGNGTTQTITNGIDLSGKGGLVWLKERGSAVSYNNWTDTVRGATKDIFSNATDSQGTALNGLTAFSSTGFTVGTQVDYNGSARIFASWTFRKQPKFFDIVTWTGDSVAGRTIAHSLGSVPGMIIVKNTSAVQGWPVYHRSMHPTAPEDYYTYLNDVDPRILDNASWNDTAPTSSVFSVGANNFVNGSGQTYVAYLFAHDAGGFGLTGTDNVISCGSYTGNGSSTGPIVTLGYEPQWIMIKPTTLSDNWTIVDNIRAMVEGGGSCSKLVPNDTTAESNSTAMEQEATGFQIKSVSAEYNTNGATYIYVAIRRGPMKVPTDATKVFVPVAYTGTNSDNRLVNTGIVTDMTMARIRTSTSTGGFYTADRLRSGGSLGTAITDAENADPDSFMTPNVGYGNSFSAMNGFGVGNDVTRQLNQSSTSQLAYAFRRAPGFFDEVCYTGTGANTTQTHNLAAVPELMIVKKRSATDAWQVYSSALANTQYVVLNTTAAVATGATRWNSTTPTSIVFSIGTDTTVNASAATYVVYLFATVAGVSKVGSYTGNGTTQTINCGFGAGGVRFVLIKRTDSTGDWYVYDTARGMTVLTDPYLLLNTTAAEVATLGSVTTVSTGFALDSTILAAINISAATYIFFAIA